MSFAENIYKLRKSFGLSQEQLADRINVSRKAIQNWENGTSIPDGTNLLLLSKKFDVSVDSLLSGANDRFREEHFDKIMPTKDCHFWECYEKDLTVELDQCEAEGKDISDYKNFIKEAAAIPNGAEKAKIGDAIFDIVSRAPQKEGYKYFEPSNYAEICMVLPDCPTEKYDESKIKDKLKGAILGRICGCLLGKPIEGMRTDVLIPLLKATDNFPMRKYITYSDITKYIAEGDPLMQPKDRTWADLVDAAPADDDTNYTVLSSVILDEAGRSFAPSDVLEAWMKYQPKDAYCTAERVAWKNYFNGYQPPFTAMYKNPYREYIGAQIRVDYYGYVNPGDVKEAARMAYNDASISHVKNGIYGAMFVAAMIAKAAVCDDVLEVIKTGLSQVPEKSRLYEEVGEIIRLYRTGMSVEDCRTYIRAKYDEYTGYGWCHTNPNAMIVAMALLYNQDDYGKAICCAVETGFDTDCNGATVGSVFGMMKGERAIGREWTAPINNKLRTNIFGFDVVEVDWLVEKALKHIGQK